jgi:Bacteriophage replication gene A protein (GPA)
MRNEANLYPVNESTRNEANLNPVNESTRNEEVVVNTSYTSLSAHLLVDEFKTDHRLDKKFIQKQLLKIPFSCRVKAKNTYNHLLKSHVKGIFYANTFLRKLGEYCDNFDIDVTWSDSAIKLAAKQRANMCYQLSCNMLHEGDTGEDVLAELEAVVRQNGINPRKGKYIDGDIARYCCENYWLKKLSRVQSTAIETISLHLLLVSKQSQIYITDANFKKGRENKRRNQAFLDAFELVNEEGECADLKDIANSTIANPVNRRNELMSRLHGCEVYADKHGYVADFVTITCPSRMHPVHNNGKPNDKFDGTTPKAANQYLCEQWAKSRAQLARLNVDYYGFRVAEPHHDATPHWHVLVFVKPEHREALRQTLTFYALQVDGNEKGAQKYRFTVEPINKSKGSAVGYISKYISKNIDGFGVDSDNYGNPAALAALRVNEWSSLWGIRQFQQFGGPPVSIWREARRLALKEEVNISSVWVAADNGDWCAFMEALGGVNVCRKDLPVSIVKEFIETEGQYWEPIGFVVKGLSCGGEIYISRDHTWTKRRKENVASFDLDENEV